MESYGTVIVVFAIFAGLCQIALLSFVALDQNSKEDYRWLWFFILAFIGPIGLPFYWFLGRER